ncbi:hypothetical protein [Bacillus sp. D386]|uniref:hypothetical protein n=1 Tax=Bacillus sp. D386 TaxID=2587155 RepID=UPI00111D4933|nr:hypothetical protein [Bacillus sp. D386]
MNINTFDDLTNFIDKLDDNFFWKPINSDETSLAEFEQYVSEVKKSFSWKKDLNWKKGKVLEELAVFIFNRFQDTNVVSNNRPADNESDIEATLSEKTRPSFMNDFIGPKILCECKNYKSKSIDVGMITKLAELIPIRGARFGVFFSILGIGGYEWRFGEGKRKKILCKSDIPIISFKFEEIESLRDGKNFYTMLKQKVKALYDEVDDESPDFPPDGHTEYTYRMLEIADHLKKCNIISHEENFNIKIRIISMYGLDELN